jgi:hypothetical protein
MIIGFSRAIGPVPLDVVLSEDHTTEIEITSNPIETGAEVNDHAYIMPKRVTLEFANNNAAAIWNALIAFQESRVPFVLVTGLSIYRNMMVKRLNAKRDATFSRILSGSADLQEVIIVDTAYAAAPGGTALPPAGNPGGALSVLSARPSSSRSIDVGTAIRAAGTIQRGDSPTVPAPLVGNSSAAVANRNMLTGIFGQ